VDVERKSADLWIWVIRLVLLEHFLKEWKYWFRFSDGDKDLLRTFSCSLSFFLLVNLKKTRWESGVQVTRSYS